MRSCLLLILSGLGLTCSATRAQGETNFCNLTAQAALHSCQVGAKSDLFLALGKCDNVADPAERKACGLEAAADEKDALDECAAQHVVRKGACPQLGPGPYDPVIDPANFGGPIDNPYFPLVPGTNYVYEGQSAEG